MVQIPPPQVAAAFVREHVEPHVPQFVSVLSGVSQPFASMPSQFPEIGSASRRRQ